MVEMLKEVQFAVCIVLCFGVSFSTKATAPNWNALTYTVEGTLQLPYAEITEPFSAYYDAKNNKSRIDYYGGMVITIQRSDMTKFGVSYKLAPMSTEKQLNMDMCFQLNGTNNDDAVTIQSILPDLTGFDMIGVEMKSGNNCTKWQKVDVQGKKKNVYTMWVGPDGKMPVRYEMHGYDSLLGSHYDKYYLDYINFGTNNIDSKKFDPPTNMTCGGFPGPGIKEHRIMMNPMREYINNDQTHIDQMFGFYKNQHSKQYPSVEEHEQRKHIFRHNVRYIHSKNRAGLTYRLAVNHLADKSSEELKLMRGFRYTPGNHGGLPFERSKYNLKDVPANLDWRLYGAVNPVKDQAVCGSCWSFGTTGTIEGAYFLKKMPKKKVWTDEERAELAKKLDSELEEYVADCIAKQKEKNEKEGEKESDLNIEDIANHPAFMTEVDWSKPLTPELEALMKLKYEDENPTAGAEAYKMDGNHEFKKKKYDIAIDNYTEGIKLRCPDKLLNSVLYTNRAAAQFHRGNYGTSLHDCIFARKFKSDHMKAILRGAMCCLKLKRYDEASRWCDTGLLIENENEEFLQMKYKAESLKKSLERDKRKEEAAERKERIEEEKLLAVIQSKGVQLASMKTNKNTRLHPSLLTNLETQNPSGAKVHVTSDGSLNWPVLFMYPEHTMTDYVEAFNEQHTFEEHLKVMFSDGFEHPQWDTDRKYTTDKLLVYFEDRDNEVMYKVNPKSTLLNVLQHKRHFVHGGTPCYVVTVDGSNYQKVFKERHKIINT